MVKATSTKLTAPSSQSFLQTEAGIIPEDWVVRPLGSLVDFLDGRRRPVKDVDRAKMRGDIPYYGASGIVDYVNNHLFDEELILLGEDGENILSRNLPLAFQISGKAWVNNHAHVLRPRSGTSIGYLTAKLESLNYEKFNSGTAQPKLNKKTCSAIPVALPPTQGEQEQIAQALSSLEALIRSLNDLIAKKHALRVGATNQLLSGTHRILGFTSDWTERSLGQIAPLQRGFDLPNSSIRPGPYPIVYSNGVSGSHVSYQIKGPGVITGRSGTLGKVFYVENDYWPHNTSLWVTDFRGNVPKFIYYLYKFIGFERFASGTGVPTLNRNDAHSYMTKVPTDTQEQLAIVEVLESLDSEISDFEKRVAKARNLKDGMMQELLTGRVRLA